MQRLAVFLTLLAPAMLAAQDPVITELMARNANTLADRDGEYPDWLEVHNPKASSIQLGGYYVTDDASDLKKWQFPATTLNAGAYMVVFASKKDRRVSGVELHTNFNLAGIGEYLALVKPDGTTVVSEFAPNYPEQRTGYSYGSVGAQLLYFPTPTPRAANGNGVKGFVCKSEIQARRGIQTSALSVAITCTTPGATIYYTLNGSPPTQASTLYTGPIQIAKTSVLRAAGFAVGLAPSPVDSRTFVFIEDTIRQSDAPPGFPQTWSGAPAADYGMDPEIVFDPRYKQTVKTGLQSVPTLSLSLPISDLFGSSGIYTNPTRTGFQWEREVSAEYFDPATGEEFQLQAGLRVQGGASRNPSNAPKHSLSLRFRDAYTGDLTFRLFPNSRVDRFDTVQLRAEYNNSWIHWSPSQRDRGMMIRDQWARDSLIAMGQRDGGHGRYVCLYLNGLFWGIYNLHERAEAAHYAAWQGGAEDDYDARNGSGTVNGTTRAWNAMRSAVTTRNWALVQKLLAVDNYIDWLIANEFAGNQDWKTGGNWRAAGGGPGDAAWRFYSWDAERTLESLTQSSTRPSTDPPDLFRYLDNIPDFVVRVGDRLHRHFFHDGALTPTQTAARFTRRTNELDTAIVAESARWGDYRRDVDRRSSGPYRLYGRDDRWIPERQRLLTSYFPGRSARVLARYVSRGLYPTLAAPVFSQHGGNVKAGYALQMLGPGQIYFTLDDSDPRAPGGAISAKAILYSGAVKLAVSTTVKARSLSSGRWSALNEARFLIESISINELLAKNSTGIRDNYGEREDWIELYNENTVAVRIGGMYLTDAETDPTRWRIPGAYLLQPGATFLIWADDEPNQVSLSDLHATFKLTTAGEEVLLYDSDGETLLDRMSFGPQVADVATGRLHDGLPQQVTFPEPTPRAPNALALCGSRRYSSLDSTLQTLDLHLLGTPGLGKSVVFQVRDSGVTGQCALLLSPLADEVSLAGITTARLLLSPFFLVVAIKPTGAMGVTDFPMAVPNQPSIVGQVAYLQAWRLGAGPWAGSPGLEIKICR
jgi:hypothetical protein